MFSSTKIMNREEICSACLEYQAEVVQISDDNVKQVFKSFVNDYTDDEQLYICYYCKNFITKVSKFKTMCLQSYLFLAEYCQDKFDQDELVKRKASAQNNISLGFSKISQVSLPNDEFPGSSDPLRTFKLKEEKVEEPKISLQIKEEIVNDEYFSPGNYDMDFKEDSSASSMEEDSNDVGGLELPIEFDNETNEINRKNYKLAKSLERIKKNEETAILLQNMIEIKVSEEEAFKEMEDMRNSDKFLQAVYKCHQCATTFDLITSLERHIKRHDMSQGPLECWVCHIRYTEKNQLATHTAQHFTKYICKLCDRVSRDRDSMKRHLENHAGINYPCHLCDRTFKSPTILARHLKGTLHAEERKYKCDQCDKAFITKDVLRAHEYVHLNIRPYTCEICLKTFKTKGYLKVHITSHKEKSNEHYCVECNIYFKTEALLKNHLENSLKHADPSMLKFPCVRCPKRYKTQKLLDFHVESSHEKIAKFSCDICGVSYTSSQGLSYHRRKVHQGFVRPFNQECPTCGRKFRSKQVLENHIRTHTGERPFKCDFCDGTFAQKTTLETHIRLKHSKVGDLATKIKSHLTNLQNN